MQVCGQLELSSVHVTFCEEAEWEALGEAGWLQRIGTQFHWHNQGYASFEDFLGALSSRKRKAIRRERRDAAASGFVLKTLRGHEITPTALEGLPPLLQIHHRQEMGPQRLSDRRASGRCWARRWATAWC